MRQLLAYCVPAGVRGRAPRWSAGDPAGLIDKHVWASEYLRCAPILILFLLQQCTYVVRDTANLFVVVFRSYFKTCFFFVF